MITRGRYTRRVCIAKQGQSTEFMRIDPPHTLREHLSFESSILSSLVFKLCLFESGEFLLDGHHTFDCRLDLFEGLGEQRLELRWEGGGSRYRGARRRGNDFCAKVKLSSMGRTLQRNPLLMDIMKSLSPTSIVSGFKSSLSCDL
jgi:hypothetical protein